MKSLYSLLIAVLTFTSSFAQFTSDMNFTDIYGNTINPTSILNEGKHIYLDFFSTSCGACNSVASEVANAYEYYGSNNENVFFIGVDYNSSISACLNFANQHNTDFPIISGQQEGGDIFYLFQQSGYPSGRLISPEGALEATFSYSEIANLTESLSNFISPVENCDLIDVLSIEVDSQNGALVLNVFTDSPYLIPYPTFTLSNSNGDLLAQEQLNYYGLSGESSHNLQLLTDPSTWDFNLTIRLYEGMSGSLACSFDISLDAIEINGCTDPNAVNFEPYAGLDDGSCLYTSNNCGAILIDINEGWNLVGFSCAEDLDASLAFSPYIDELIIAKDYLGNAFLPEWNFNGIGTLERGFGYQIKISVAINEFNLCNP